MNGMRSLLQTTVQKSILHYQSLRRVPIACEYLRKCGTPSVKNHTCLERNCIVRRIHFSTGNESNNNEQSWEKNVQRLAGFVKTRNFSKAVSNQFSLKDQLLLDYLDSLLERYSLAQKFAMDPGASSEHEIKNHQRTLVELEAVCSRYQRYKEIKEDMKELENLLSGDNEMDELIKTEKQEGIEEMRQLENEILLYTVPPERGDHSDVVLEVSAGVGGQEAMLFCGDIFQMYNNLAAHNLWHFDIIQWEEVELGGLRKASAMISGDSVYRDLKFEGGVHRVQRVPKTEKAGRIHTSTVSVAILPQATEIEIKIDRKDLKIDTFRSSGAGGQHVNKTDSAVRLTHLPTKIVVECQVDRSQLKNRATAMKILQSRLYERELEQQTKYITSRRKVQVGTSGRSEKIRTYNFVQDRITDHRISGNFHNMTSFLSGREDLQEMIENVQEEYRKEILREILEKFKIEKQATTSSLES